MRFLLRGLTISVTLLAALPAQPQPSGPQITAMVEALRMAAPKSAPGLYSEWGVTPGIIASWTKQCVGSELTPEQFGNSPERARETVTCIMRRELNKQFRATNNNETAAVRSVACWWLTGNYSGCTSGNQAAYVQRVVGFYQKESPPQQTPTSSPSPSPTASPSAAPSQAPLSSPSPSPSPTASPSPSPSPSP